MGGESGITDGEPPPISGSLRQQDKRLARLRELAVEGRHPGIPVIGADVAAKQTEMYAKGYTGLYALSALEDVWAALDADDYVSIVTALTRYTLTWEREVGIRR